MVGCGVRWFECCGVVEDRVVSLGVLVGTLFAWGNLVPNLEWPAWLLVSRARESLGTLSLLVP